MPLLGGLFSRRKSKKKREESAEPDSAQTSPTSSSYVHVNGSQDSNHTKLRLPFGRKKQSVPPPIESPPGRTSAGTSPPDLRRLRPPPSRSAIFTAYGDPESALSTRSLPTSDSDPPRRPSIFAWGKPEPTPNTSDPQSFNLKSFRHVRPPSPTNVSNSSLTPPVPRPRGPSFNSDPAQRISVAAFREAQLRRSTAGSPVPDSPNSLIQPRPRPARSNPHIPQQTPRSSLAVTSVSDSDSSTSSEEQDSEDDTIHVPKLVPRKIKPKAKSEIGHGNITDRPDKIPDLPSYRAPQFPPQQRFSGYEDKKQLHDIPPRSQSSLGVYSSGLRPRASVSTSALSPSPAAKRASIVAASNSKLASIPASSFSPSQQLRTQPSRGSITTTHTRRVDSDADSEDDAPLATLMAPRRPGSAMSSSSNTPSRSTGNVTTRSTTSHHAHAPYKPLIDINDLTRAPQRSYTSPNTAGFTEGPTLLSQQSSLTKSSRTITASPPPMSPVSTPPWKTRTSAEDSDSLTRKTPPIKFVSPPASPAKDMFQFVSITPDAEQSNSGGGAIRKISQESNDGPAVKRDATSEVRRDPITDRLTRALKKKSQPSLGAGSGSSSSTVPAAENQRRSTSQELSSGDASDASRVPPRKSIHAAAEARQQAQTNLPPRLQMPFPIVKSTEEHSPPDEELAQLLGNAVQFISRNGDDTPSPPVLNPQGSSSTTSESSESDEEDDDDDDEYEKLEKPEKERSITPILIKQRSPPPSFSVTSRPPLVRHDGVNATGNSAAYAHTPRQRSSTLVATSSSSSSIAFRKASMGGESISVTSSSHKSTTSTGKLVGFPNGSSSGSNNSNSLSLQTSTTTTTDQRTSALKSPTVHMRQRSYSSTMITGVPLSAQMGSAKKFTNGTMVAPDKPFNKPFAGARRNSPASSTGDSSSGRAPLTPRDGSDIGVGMPSSRDDGNSNLKSNSKQQQQQQHQHQPQPKKHVKRRSVSFEDDVQDARPSQNRKQKPHFIGGALSTRGGSDAGDTSNEEDREERRRGRRRSEAKAAIELGNVINGKGPIMDDEDHDMPINQAMNPRMSALNPMMAAMGNPMAMQMGYGGSPNNLAPGSWGGQNMGNMGNMHMGMNMNMGMGMNGNAQQMLSPAQFMVPPPADPNFYAAHQHAMLIAKQAYQMAVAQQAMAAAADEWERGSAVGGFGPGSGGGGGGSVYGGPGAVPPRMMQPQFGGMMMQGGGGGGGWPASASGYDASRSMYGGSQLGLPMDGMMSSSRSEYGGGGGGGRGGNNWSSSRSTYGESFGPSQDQPFTRRGGAQQQQQQGIMRVGNRGRDSGYFPPVPPMPAAHSSNTNGRNSPDGRPRTTKQSLSPSRGPAPQRKAPPPSSWKLAK